MEKVLNFPSEIDRESRRRQALIDKVVSFYRYAYSVNFNPNILPEMRSSIEELKFADNALMRFFSKSVPDEWQKDMIKYSLILRELVKRKLVSRI